ncbi:TetR/AcrR family transcriptional regulator [Thermodesulfobacteriota bacterium]
MNEEEKIPTRKKILLAAEEVFSESGFHKTLVEDIAHKAKLGKGTIYTYFKTKKELFQSLIFDSIDEIKERVSITVNKEQESAEKLKAGIKAYLEFFKEHKGIFGILIFEHSEVGCDDHQDCFEIFIKSIEGLSMFVSAGIKEGTFSDIDPKTVSYGILGSINYIIFKWLMSKEEYDLMDELDAIYEIVFNGIKS